MTGATKAELLPDKLLATWAGSSVPQEKGAALILSTVVTYPRRDKIGLIIADTLLCNMDEGECPSDSVSLIDIASITTDEPDPSMIAACINAYHEAAGIPVHLPNVLAGRFVRRCGLLSLECIRRATVFYAKTEGVPAPDTLSQPIISPLTPACRELHTGRGVPDLQAFLCQEEEVRFCVATSIQDAAETVRFEDSSMLRGHGMGEL